ncbi:isochorismatase family protein [Nocardiopsis ansamitocini]|uniref:Cysteine hydrolase n=1 Tax=Nocardiopsis ansamitocini TaxID=1670832 RepID=A0A9W6P237_9ACTN|nr:isochorismatase family protein [Nocardiopsis ansamitocini]GLU45809.1 cysteine hydrolase [Nocardiopsis ansamitocini]
MTTVLLLIDVQRNMLQPPEPVPAAAEVAPVLADLLERARFAGAPVVHVRNNGGPDDPDETGTFGWELVCRPRTGELVVDKTEPDAFSGTPLAGLLPVGASVVIAGMQSEFCVRATARAAMRRGHPVTLVRGAHATYDDAAPAHGISQDVEKELVHEGAALADLDEVRFA